MSDGNFKIRYIIKIKILNTNHTFIKRFRQARLHSKECKECNKGYSSLIRLEAFDLVADSLSFH